MRLSDEDRKAGWIEWPGGECPVPLDTVVEYRLRSGRARMLRATGLYWQHDGGYDDTIAYRVVDAPLEKIVKRAPTGHDAPPFEQLADYARDLHRQLTEWQHKAAQAATAWHGCIHRAEAAEQHLGNILAIIHRDDGSYRAEHGNEKAVADAIKVVSDLRTTCESLKAINALPVGDAERDTERYREWKRSFREGECGLYNALCDAQTDAEHDAAIDAAIEGGIND